MPQSLALAVLGRTGFVGRLIGTAASEAGHTVRAIPSFRVENAYKEGVPPDQSVNAWLEAHGDECRELVHALEGADVLINAAGMAEPESDDIPSLHDANVILAGVAARLASSAGVRRLIHISSAAVQGRRDPLDESRELEPLTAYGRSKAAGERLLLREKLDVPDEVTVYRPTSVQGISRTMTRRLVALASKPLVPLPGDGSAPVPVCLGENMAAGVLHTLNLERCPAIVLQAWEGLTTRTLLESIGDGPKFVRVPPSLARAGVEIGYLLGRRASRMGAIARRLDLLVAGQRQEAKVLTQSGFEPPFGIEQYRLLADQIRAEVLDGSRKGC